MTTSPIMEKSSEPYALGAGDGRPIDLGEGFAVAVKADELQSGGVVSVLETQEPPGFGPPVHVHHDCAEAFYVLEGEYVMYLGEDEVVCRPGSFIFVPRGVPHGFRTGNAVSRKLNFYFPASMVGYFDDLSAVLRQQDVGDDELAKIAAQHGMEIVGPPSDRYV
jgi:mannose-6-phosphate isomerase-like protein (cupin superfamily)